MKKQKMYARISQVLLIAAAVVSIENMRAWSAGLPEQTMLPAVAGAALVMVAEYYLAQLVDTAGSLLGGLATGYRLIMFQLMCVRWVNRKGHIALERTKPSLRINRVMVPPDREPLPFRAYLLTGTSACAVFGAAALAGGLCCPASSLARVLLVPLGLMMLWCMAASLLPGIGNPGWMLWKLLREPASRPMLRRWLQMTAELVDGTPLREMPDEWFDLPAASELAEPYEMELAYNSAVRHFPDLERADAAIAKVLAQGKQMHPFYRSILEAERLWIEMVCQARPEVLAELNTELVQQLRGAALDRCAVLRLDYTEALRRGDRQQAQAVMQRFEQWAAHTVLRQEIQNERELFAIADRRYGSVQAQADNTTGGMTHEA